MSKTNGAPRKAPTHFETVPLEVVKKIAVEDVVSDPVIDAEDEMVAPAKKQVMPVPTRAPAGRESGGRDAS
jgi:hypothetical protein